MKQQQNPIEEYPTVGWPALEELSSGKCPCCDQDFGEDNRPDLAARCHLGPVELQYWGDYLYVTCATCNRPVCRIPVDRRLV